MGKVRSLVLTGFFILLLVFFSVSIVRGQGSCSGDLKPCSEDYPESCTTSDGRQGVRICHKHGCSNDGRPGPGCSWGPGSWCEPCRSSGGSSGGGSSGGGGGGSSNNSCRIKEGQSAGYCQPASNGACRPTCKSGWSQGEEGPGKVCQVVRCSCGNTVKCCKELPPTPTPTPIRICRPEQTVCVSTRECPQGCRACSKDGTYWYCTASYWCNWCRQVSQPPTSTPTPTPTPTRPPAPTPTPTPTVPPPPPPTIAPTATPTPKPTIQFLTPTPTPRGSSAREDSPRLVGWTWVCLKADYHAQYRLKLSGTLPDKVKNVYIIGCIEYSGSFYCTTGKPSEDEKLRLSLPSSLDYKFELNQPPSNPFTLNSNEIKDVVVFSKAPDGITQKFYAAYEKTAENIIGHGSSPQLATIPFTEGAEQQCVMIKWDPRGRVFEKGTSHPVKGVKLTLYDLQKRKVKEPGLENPIFTDENGRFDFVVKEGEYYLEIEPPKGYIIDKSKKLVKVYSKEKQDDLIIYLKKESRLKEWINKVTSFLKSLWQGL